MPFSHIPAWKPNERELNSVRSLDWLTSDDASTSRAASLRWFDLGRKFKSGNADQMGNDRAGQTPTLALSNIRLIPNLFWSMK